MTILYDQEVYLGQYLQITTKDNQEVLIEPIQSTHQGTVNRINQTVHLVGLLVLKAEMITIKGENHDQEIQRKTIDPVVITKMQTINLETDVRVQEECTPKFNQEYQVLKTMIHSQ